MYVDHFDQKCIVYLNTYAPIILKSSLNSFLFVNSSHVVRENLKIHSIQKKLTNKSIFTFFPPNLIKVTYVLNTYMLIMLEDCRYGRYYLDNTKNVHISCRLRSVLFDIMQHTSKDRIIFSIFPHFFIVS